MAAAYFAAVSSGQPDHGYSLINPVNRASWAYDEYARDVTTADWSSFSVTVVETRFCDDGMYCPVCLEIPGGIDSVPPFMRATDNRAADGIIFFAEGPNTCGNAEISVGFSLLPWENATGIQLSDHD